MTHEDEVRRECERLGINPNEIPPDNCPACGSELEVSKGYVGEGILRRSHTAGALSPGFRSCQRGAGCRALEFSVGTRFAT
jgi:hypothetical protein